MNRRPNSIEVIDEADHAYCRDNVDIKLSYQHGGKALKVFVWGQELMDERNVQAIRTARNMHVTLSDYGMQQVAKRIREGKARRARLEALQEELLSDAIKLAERHQVDRDDLIWTLYDLASILEK